jgi:large subunit ribosomal protein L21
MFAVIKTGGKQYKVAADDEITVMTLVGEAGAEITFDQVLSYSDGTSLQIGAPLVDGATVAGEIVRQARGPKVISFKKRRRQNSKRKRGHRQDLTIVRITDILLAGQQRRPRSAQAETSSTPAAEAASA